MFCLIRCAIDGRCEIVLTSYETSRDNIEEINQVAWNIVIVDECHRIKEPTSRTTIALKSLGNFLYYELQFTDYVEASGPFWPDSYLTSNINRIDLK
jgi:hypothetical protein